MTDGNENKLSMLPDGTILRFQYQRGGYAGVEYRATVKNGRIEVQGETWTPSGAAREVDKLIRGDEGHKNWNGWRKWEWNQGNGNWIAISNLKDD